jgi:hypothetical protein
MQRQLQRTTQMKPHGKGTCIVTSVENLKMHNICKINDTMEFQGLISDTTENQKKEKEMLYHY